MEDNIQNINWLEEACRFFVDMYPVKQERDFEKIYRQTTLLLRQYAHAHAAALVRLEDDISARILYSAGLTLRTLSDAAFIGGIVRDGKIVVAPAPDEAVYIYIPVNEMAFAGAFVLQLSPAFDMTADFSRFLEHVWIGLKETSMLIQTYYSIEQLSTRFQAILGTIPESIVFIDDRGRQGWANHAAADLLKIKGEDNDPAKLSAAMQSLRNDALNQESIALEGMKLFSSPNKTIRNWEWIFGNPISRVLCVSCVPATSANIKGRLWVFEDVTEKYLADVQLKELNDELAEKRRIADDQNKAKSDFLANMSHEIRTPMNGIIGMTSLLTNTALDDQQTDCVETIRVSGESLLSIINDILDFSKIESGKMELECSPVNIRSVIEDTYDLLSVKANEKGLDLLYVIDPEVPAEILGDIIRLKQVMTNLVSNGLKFTEKGEILITVETLQKQGDSYNLRFTVKDTGIGIPQDKFYRLFETFSQVDSSTTRKYGGTGLGLAICHRLISMMGGSIHAESEINKGSSFIFDIWATASRRMVQYVTREAIAEAQLKGKTILVLDDNSTNLKILRKQCEEWGMIPMIADNYRTAFEELGKRTFDLAIVDLLMPEKDGIEVSRLMKAQHGELPIILFSSAGFLPADDKNVRDLFAAIINKPIRYSQIERTFIEVLTKGNMARKKQVAATEAAIGLSPISILVAEDNEINQKLIMRTLDKLGYSYDVVGDGGEVVGKLKEKRYQLILMDIMMPVMDGYEAAAQVRKEFSDAGRPVIIAMTANALTGDREKILASGMDDYISKPFMIKDIKSKIDEWEPQLMKKL